MNGWPDRSEQDESELVTIGIPTYNRAFSITRTLDSVLAQSYRNIEVRVSDNASTDGTPSVCQAYCARDSRVKYLRQGETRIAEDNFLAVLDGARGKYFMWLADDDWITADYISECVSLLESRPDYSLVGGRPLYFSEGKRVTDGGKVNLPHASERRRVRNYFHQVSDNSIFYGVMRREQLQQVPLRKTLGSDWMLVAGMASLGKISTLESVRLCRSMGGASQNLEQVGLDLGLPIAKARNPFRTVSASIFKDIGWDSPVYRHWPKAVRIVTAAGASFITYYRCSSIDRRSPMIYVNKVRAFLGIRTNLRRVLQRIT